MRDMAAPRALLAVALAFSGLTGLAACDEEDRADVEEGVEDVQQGVEEGAEQVEKGIDDSVDTDGKDD